MIYLNKKKVKKQNQKQQQQQQNKKEAQDILCFNEISKCELLKDGSGTFRSNTASLTFYMFDTFHNYFQTWKSKKMQKSISPIIHV